MKTTKKEKVIAAGVAIILMVSFTFMSVLYKQNNESKQKGSDLALEVLELHAKISDYDTESLALRKSLENANLEQLNVSQKLGDANARIAEKELELKKAKGNGPSSKQLKKQIADLTKLKAENEAKLSNLNRTIHTLTSEYDGLKTELAKLKQENEEVAANMKLMNSLSADNYMVETTKKKSRLTVMAKRTKNMKVSFVVPENLAANLSFQVTKPDGSVVKGKGLNLSYNVVEDGTNLLVYNGSEPMAVSKKVEVVYQPKEKLKPGIYKISMYNGDKYVGACNVKLR